MKFLLSFLALGLFLVSTGIAADDGVQSVSDSSPNASAAGEEINWQVLSGGGGRSTSASYILTSSVGQTAVGPGSSASYNLNSGFIQNFTSGGGGCCVGTAGDVNGDGTDADPVDLAFLVDFLFAGGAAPSCPEEADVNGDTNSADPVDLAYLVDFLFAGGTAPVGC